MEPQNGIQVINALVRKRNVQYSVDLRSITQGRGDFEIEFDHEEESRPIWPRIVANAGSRIMPTGERDEEEDTPNIRAQDTKEP